MTFADAISTSFRKYATFDGIARRSEFWWFMLFCLLASLILNLFGEAAGAAFNLATLLPSLAVGARRLHDTDRSGWWQLLGLIPVVGWIVLIVFWAQEGKANRYHVAGVVA